MTQQTTWDDPKKPPACGHTSVFAPGVHLGADGVLSEVLATALYDFTPPESEDNAATLTVGEEVRVLVPDDGSGWSEVQNSKGTTGHVPTGYLHVNAIGI